MSLLWLLLGPIRLAFGGGIRPGLRTIATVLAVLIAVGAAWPDLARAAANSIGLLVLMTLPHGPYLTLPIGPRKEGSPDPLYPFVAWIKNDELRWWAFSLLRYPGVAAPWSAALYLLGNPGWFAPAAGAFLIPATYRVLWPFRDRLPHFNRPGDQVQNWTELCGWELFALTLAAFA